MYSRVCPAELNPESLPPRTRRFEAKPAGPDPLLRATHCVRFSTQLMPKRKGWKQTSRGRRPPSSATTSNALKKNNCCADILVILVLVVNNHITHRAPKGAMSVYSRTTPWCYVLRHPTEKKKRQRTWILGLTVVPCVQSAWRKKQSKQGTFWSLLGCAATARFINFLCDT